MFRLRQEFDSIFRRNLITLAVIIFAVLAVYWPALNGQFIWDDTYLVGENPLFRSPIFSLEVFRHFLFLDSISTYYRPVQNLSYMWDYWLWRDTPFGYHFTNALLHGFSAFWLYLLLKQILPNLLGAESEENRDSKAAGMAFCIALLWTVHPIHNAAVAYISGRADSLIAFFALSGWLLFLAGEKRTGWGRWLLWGSAFFAAILALCSKEAGLLWAVLFALWFSCRGGWACRLFQTNAQRASQQQRPLADTAAPTPWVLFALCCAVGIYAWLHHLPGERPTPPSPVTGPFPQRVILMFRALGDYTGLIFWPAHLHMERSLGEMGPYADMAAWIRNLGADYKAVLGLVTLAVFGFGVVNRGTGRQVRVLGAGWFLVGFLPISNLIPLNAQAAEHWIYMPSIGFLVFLAGLALDATNWEVPIVALALLATVPLGIRTAYRSADWSSPETFFNQTVKAGGGTHRVQLNLSNLMTSKGNLHGAEQMLRDTLKQFPRSPLARINLGINLLDQKDPAKQAEAEKLLDLDKATLEQASKLLPYAWRAPLNLAGLRVTQHRESEALQILDTAIEFFPNVWEMVAYRASILRSIQGAAAAIPGVQNYVDTHWWHYKARILLGDLRAANHQPDLAVAAWSKAAQFDIHASQPFLRMAKAAFSSHQFQQALQAQEQAISRDPDSPTNYLLLAAIFDQLQRPGESEAALRKGQELKERMGQR